MFSQCAVTVAALRLLPSRMGCNRKDRDVMGDVYRRHGANMFARSLSFSSHSVFEAIVRFAPGGQAAGWLARNFILCLFSEEHFSIPQAFARRVSHERDGLALVLACLPAARRPRLIRPFKTEQNKQQPISRPTTAKHSSPPNHSTIHQQPNGRTHDFWHWFDAGTCHFRFHKGY